MKRVLSHLIFMTLGVNGFLAMPTAATLPADLRLSGRVTDQRGIPVAGAEIVFQRQANPAVRGDALTDSSGHYAVDLRGARAATGVSAVSWAFVKATPAAKMIRAHADTLVADLLAVSITHAEIAPFSRDSLRVPADGVLDFVVERIHVPGSLVSADADSAGVPVDAVPAGPGELDGEDAIPPGSGGADASSSGDTGGVEPELIEVLGVALEGQYIRGLSLRAEKTSFLAGDTIRIRFVGLGLAQVKQFEFVLDLPWEAIDISGVEFSRQPPFIGPGIEWTLPGTIRVGGAITSRTETAEGDVVLGDLRLPTRSSLREGAAMLLQKVSFGPRSNARDTFEELNLRIPVVVR